MSQVYVERPTTNPEQVCLDLRDWSERHADVNDEPDADAACCRYSQADVPAHHDAACCPGRLRRRTSPAEQTITEPEVQQIPDTTEPDDTPAETVEQTSTEEEETEAFPRRRGEAAQRGRGRPREAQGWRRPRAPLCTGTELTTRAVQAAARRVESAMTRPRLPVTMSLLDRISIDPDVVHGRPAIRGTRMLVTDVLPCWPPERSRGMRCRTLPVSTCQPAEPPVPARRIRTPPVHSGTQASEPSSAASLRKNGPRTPAGAPIRPARGGPSQPRTERCAAHPAT